MDNKCELSNTSGWMNLGLSTAVILIFLIEVGVDGVLDSASPVFTFPSQ